MRALGALCCIMSSPSFYVLDERFALEYIGQMSAAQRRLMFFVYVVFVLYSMCLGSYFRV